MSFASPLTRGRAGPQNVSIGRPLNVRRFDGRSRIADQMQERKKSFLDVGKAEVILGSLSIILAIISIGLARSEEDNYIITRTGIEDYYYRYEVRNVLPVTYSAQGIWGGFFIIITGVLGIRVKDNTSFCLYVANMVMSMLTAVITGAVIILSVLAAILSTYYSHPISALHAVIGAINFVSLVVCIKHATLCCCGMCCNCNEDVGSHQEIVYHLAPSEYTQGPDGRYYINSNLPIVVHGFPPVAQPESMPSYIRSSSPEAGPPSYFNVQYPCIQPPPSYSYPKVPIANAV